MISSWTFCIIDDKYYLQLQTYCLACLVSIQQSCQHFNNQYREVRYRKGEGKKQLHAQKEKYTVIES